MAEIRTLGDFGKEFYGLCLAGAPIITVTTPEESRFVRFFESTLRQQLHTDKYYTWTADAAGQFQWKPKDGCYGLVGQVQRGEALATWVERLAVDRPGNERSVLIVQDGFNTMMSAGQQEVLRMCRILKREFRNQLDRLRSGTASPDGLTGLLNLVFVESEPRTGGTSGPSYLRGGWPYSLVPYIQNIDFPRPDEDTLREEVKMVLPRQVIEGVLSDDDSKKVDTLVSCGLGLTADQFFLTARRVAQEVLASAGTPERFFQALESSHYRMMNEAKHEIIRAAEGLEIYSFHGPREKVVVIGLDKLSDWLDLRRDAFLQRTPKKVPVPSGIILIGYPGTGKSTTAKFVARAWNLTLVRLDMGKVLNPYVGEAEASLRRALIICERVAPVVLWIDELEKSWGTGQGPSGDSGVTQRLLGNFIIWLQEHLGRVFVVATCNALEAIPPEFQRRGRFDEIFFVGLPNERARREIVRHMIEKHWTFRESTLARDFEGYFEEPGNLADFNRKTRLFTGAELESAVKQITYMPLYLAEGPEFTPARIFGPGGEFYEHLGEQSDYQRYHATKKDDPLRRYAQQFRLAGEHETLDALPAEQSTSAGSRANV
jgi:hypothetical protein